MKSKYINKTKLYIVDVVIFVLALVSDRVTKHLALTKLKGHPAVSAISGILEFRYIENSGAAFGLLKGQNSFFVLVAIIVFLASLYVIVRTPARKKYIMAHILLSMIVSGAIGNMTDRLMQGYVTDFIYFSFIHFPIFNLADVFVSVASFLLVILLLFYYKEDDLNFLKFLEKKIRDVD